MIQGQKGHLNSSQLESGPDPIEVKTRGCTWLYIPFERNGMNAGRGSLSSSANLSLCLYISTSPGHGGSDLLQ